MAAHRRPELVEGLAPVYDLGVVPIGSGIFFGKIGFWLKDYLQHNEPFGRCENKDEFVLSRRNGIRLVDRLGCEKTCWAS